MSEYVWVEEDLARVIASSGDSVGALDFANQAVTQAENRATTSPQSEAVIGGLARAYATLAAVQENAGDVVQARKTAERALDVWRRVGDRGVISIHSELMADTERLLVRIKTTSP